MLLPAILTISTFALLGWALWTPDLQRRLLLSRYAGVNDSVVEVAGVRLQVRDQGNPLAPPVVLLHGFGASLQSWQGWAEWLSRTHRVVRLDLPGFGLTGPDPTGSYSDERSLEVLAALLQHLGLDCVDLVGHSLGGRYAWKFAAEHPQRVRRLVLVAPDGYASGVSAHLLGAGPPAWAPMLRHILPKFLVWLDLAIAFGDPRRLRGATVNRYFDMLRAPGVRSALLARWSQIRLSDPGPTLAAIRAPTLLVWGTRDRLAPASQAYKFKSAISDSQIEWIAGAGQMPQEELPLQSIASVADFLKF